MQEADQPDESNLGLGVCVSVKSFIPACSCSLCGQVGAWVQLLLWFPEAAVVSGDTSLTFEQRGRLLLLQLEIKRIKIEERGLITGGFGAGHASVAASGSSASAFDVANNLRVVPQFCEQGPDTFFSLSERVAEGGEWSDPDHILLLQCVLTSKAQAAFSALRVAESSKFISLSRLLCL